MKTITHFHTAGILVALCMGAACTSNQGVLGVTKKGVTLETVSRDTLAKEEETIPLNASENAMVVARGSSEEKTNWDALRVREMFIRETDPPIILDKNEDTKVLRLIFQFTGDPSVSFACQKRDYPVLLCRLNKKSCEIFFEDPRSYWVALLAYFNKHKSAKKVRDNFMYELYTRADKKTLINWFKNAPRELFALDSPTLSRLFSEDIKDSAVKDKVMRALYSSENAYILFHWLKSAPKGLFLHGSDVRNVTIMSDRDTLWMEGRDYGLIGYICSRAPEKDVREGWRKALEGTRSEIDFSSGEMEIKESLSVAQIDYLAAGHL